ncbi:3'-5' exonuclease KapD [Bacillus carboniphilus]|uniref:3'-5' exonuclease KapD n=1 Tax=Bacillus carboniphilus TaxID=86663 RepID=A0ABY9JPC0_9BACI|nr:3'-5' exonuclease KapD [Bacillus carboniphilus]WLR41254.1 3'-5' exonuclease KapD [Bacillus carboniphilus]
MKEDKSLLFIDFEFTMPERKFHPQGFFPEIIEVGMVCVLNQKIERKFSSFVKPTFFPELTERCKSFLSITQEEVDHGISFYELTSILKQIDRPNKRTVITWGNMDMRVLKSNCVKHHLPNPLKGKNHDLSMEYKRFFGDKNQTGLWKAVEEYGKKGTGKHHCALDDAMTTLNIYNLVQNDKRYLEEHQPTTIGDRIDKKNILKKFAT